MIGRFDAFDTIKKIVQDLDTMDAEKSQLQDNLSVITGAGGGDKNSFIHFILFSENE